MRQNRDNAEPATVGSIDDAYRYLARVCGWRDDRAIHELNQKLAKGDLRLHYRRTDAAGIGQEGDVPSVSWSRQFLRVALDRNADVEPGPLDWATGQITAGNDGRAFVQLCVAQQGCPTYELTLSMTDVRLLWSSDAPKPLRLKRTSADFAVLTPRIRLTVLALDQLEDRGIVIAGMLKAQLLTHVRKQAATMSPGSTVSPRTLSGAETYRSQHPN